MQVYILTRKHLVIALIIAICCIGIGLVTTVKQIVATVSNLSRTVVIDAGHGSIDPGAHYQGIEEKDINLQVAYILKELLEEANIKVIMTRLDDSLYNKSRRDDIIYRARVTNEVKPDAFISIHVNKFPTSEPFGGQAYYASGETSKMLADKIQAELRRIQPNSYRQSSRGDYYVLNKANCPAVLVEIGFLSNPVDRSRMTDPKTQREIAGAIRTGLLTFLNENLATSSRKRKDLKKTSGDFVYKIDNLTNGFDLYFTELTRQGEFLLPVHQPLPIDRVVTVDTAMKLTFLERVATEAILSLIAGPTTPNLFPVLPAETQLLSLHVNQGLATVNFSKELSENHWGSAIGEQRSIEAIVKTLTNFHGIDRVQILIEGKSGQSIAGHVYFDQPLTLDMF